MSTRDFAGPSRAEHNDDLIRQEARELRSRVADLEAGSDALVLKVREETLRECADYFVKTDGMGHVSEYLLMMADAAHRARALADAETTRNEATR